MSDPMPAVSSSPPPSRPSPTGQLAFLVHSPETVANHMPPEVDNKALARQKRRRTRYVFLCLLLLNCCTAFIPNRVHHGWTQRAGTCSCASHGLSSAYPAKSDNSARIHTYIHTYILTISSRSKEDEDILKSEYLKNPKPDKTARLEIVRRVALGEKEVQVRRDFASLL